MECSQNKLNVVIIGAGMYVCGRGTKEFGTILPAMCEWKRQGKNLGKVLLAATNFESIKQAKGKLNELNNLMGTNLQVKMFPDSALDTRTYLDAVKEIPKPACAIVVVPDHLHEPVTIDCLRAGLPSLVVKPLAPNLTEAKNIIDVQAENQLYGMVEFHKRFDRANLKLKKVLNDGQIGDPLYFIVEYSQKKSIPSKTFAAWFDSTNIFQYLGVHYVDIIYFATRAIPKRVMALGQYGWLKDKGFQTYDAVHATIEWETENKKRFLSYILTNWIDPENTTSMSDQKIKVIGTKGRYESDQKCRGISMVSDELPFEQPNPDFCSMYPGHNGYISYQGYGIDSVQAFIQDVMHINEGKTNIALLEKIRPTFNDSLVSVAVIDAVNKSLGKHGHWTPIIY